MATINRLYSNYENANKGSRVITLDKLTSTEIYSLFISKAQNKRSFNIFFKNRYNDYNIDWTAISMLPCLVTYNTFMRSCKYKILNNILFLNEKLHNFGIRGGFRVSQVSRDDLCLFQ